MPIDRVFTAPERPLACATWTWAPVRLRVEDRSRSRPRSTAGLDVIQVAHIGTFILWRRHSSTGIMAWPARGGRNDRSARSR